MSAGCALCKQTPEITSAARLGYREKRLLLVAGRLAVIGRILVFNLAVGRTRLLLRTASSHDSSENY